MDIKVELKNGMILIVDNLGNHQINKIVEPERGKPYEALYCGYYPNFRSLLLAFGKKRVGKVLSAGAKKDITGILGRFKAAEAEMKGLAEEIGGILDEKRREIDGKKRRQGPCKW